MQDDKFLFYFIDTFEGDRLTEKRVRKFVQAVKLSGNPAAFLIEYEDRFSEI